VTNSTAVRFDAAMMARYGQSAPRYTSYPTALQFKDSVESGEYLAAAACSEDALRGEPLSLYVHIPFCLSPCLYCGCNKIVTRRTERAEHYVRHLSREISLRAGHFARDRPVEQMHFGGGTPTYLPKQLLIEIMGNLAHEFRLSETKSRDYSIEIDPRSVDRDCLQLLKELGFNRVSLGIQDFDSEVQRAVNRVQPEKNVQHVYDAAREWGFQSINFDLICGLPLQTLATFTATLNRVVAMRPDRLAVYGYAHMPQLFKAQRHIRQEELPNAATRMALQELAIDKLVAAGYVYIGLDHFALPTDSLAQAKRNHTLHRSFQGYTTHANRDLVSFGVSAIGKVGNLYVQNYKLIKDYEAAIARGALPSQRGTTLSADDRIRADVIQQIMCHGRIDISEVEDRHHISFSNYFSLELARLRALQCDGLVELAERHVTLTVTGRLLMRAVAMSFDAYINPVAQSDALMRANGPSL
jgi:oxygen-independent coproporphyrinogen III oxidase